MTKPDSERLASLEAHRENDAKDIAEINAGVKELLRLVTSANGELQSVNRRLEAGQKKMDATTARVDLLDGRTTKLETANEVLRGQVGLMRWLAGALGLGGIATAWKAFIGGG